MSVKTKLDYSDETTLEVSVTVSKDEYDVYSQKILSQMAKGVKVKGFRPGKAPVEKAIQHLDPQTVQNNIINESLQKFANPALKEAQEKLKKNKRSFFGSALKKVEDEKDGGIKFVIDVHISPEFDIDKLTKIKFPKVEKKEMPERFEKKDYIKKEINEFIAGYNIFEKEAKEIKDLYKVVLDMKISFGEQESQDSKQETTVVIGTRSCPPDFTKVLIGKKVGDKVKTETGFNMGMPNLVKFPVELEVKEIYEPKYKTFDEVVKVNDKAKSEFKTQKELEQKLLEAYDIETENIQRDIKYRKVIKNIQNCLTNYPFNAQRYNQDKVVENTKEKAKNAGIEWIEYLKNQNILDKDQKYDEKSATKTLKEVYKNEELYLQLLRVVYDFYVESKITKQDLDNMKQQVRSQSEQRGEKLTKDQLEVSALDVLMRQKALNYLLKEIENFNK